MGKIAAALGTPFIPWQQYVADIAGEVDPKTGRLWYRKVVVLVPRQSGKTTIDLAHNVYRAFGFAGYTAAEGGGPQTITYTAQTRNDARQKWIKQELMLRATPFVDLYDLREANGSESILWKNGSTHGLAATQEKSGHGPTLDKGTIDEAFAQVDYRVEKAMKPAMIARKNAQLWALSTAGDLTSIYLNEEISKGRERCEAGDIESRTCYIEYSAPEDCDPSDEEVWWACMPGLGWHIGIDEVRAEYLDTIDRPREFARGYLNLTDNGAGMDAVVSAEIWDGSAVDTSIIGPRCFALDVANDRSWASISWGGKTPENLYLSEVVARQRGTHWIVPWFVEKFAKYPKYKRQVYVVGNAQASLMTDAFEKAGIELVILSRADYAAACAKYYDGLHAKPRPEMCHLPVGQKPLDIAISGAAWSTGDARVWSRTKSTVDISPLVACTVARWGFELESASDYDVSESIA